MSEDDDLEEVDRSAIRARRDELVRRAKAPVPATPPPQGPEPMTCLSMPEPHARLPQADARPSTCLSMAQPHEGPIERVLRPRDVGGARRIVLAIVALALLTALAVVLWRALG